MGLVLGLTRERRLAASKTFELITDDVDLAENHRQLMESHGNGLLIVLGRECQWDDVPLVAVYHKCR